MNKFVNYTLIAAALFCVVTITMIGALAAMYYMTPPPVEYVTVEVPAPAVIETVTVEVERVIEVPVTATPAPAQIAAEPYPAPVQPTPIPPTATEPPVDYAEIVSITAPSDVKPNEVADIVVIVRNAGNVTWLDYSMQWKHGEQTITQLDPGGEAVLVFPIPSAESTHGVVSFEFAVYNASGVQVPWIPAGGSLYAPPEPVIDLRVWGYKPTEIPPEKWEQWLNNNLPQFGKWRCEGGT